MLQSTTQKVGNSIMIPLPKQLHPQNNAEYIITQTRNGAIILTPKTPNPFASSEVFQDDPSVFEKHAMKKWNVQ